MSAHSRQRKSVRRKRCIAKRLASRTWPDQPRPMFGARNIHDDVADHLRATGVGGIGAVHLLAQRVGLVRRLNEHLHVLKRHLPYHESDHVRNIGYNLLAGGDCLEDLELLRQDEACLDALGAQRIPDPTTEGDFCRRLTRRPEPPLTAESHTPPPARTAPSAHPGRGAIRRATAGPPGRRASGSRGSAARSTPAARRPAPR